jgi:hypothetical protein
LTDHQIVGGHDERSGFKSVGAGQGGQEDQYADLPKHTQHQQC